MRQIAILSFILIVFASCHHVTGSGNIVTDEKQVESFTGISANNGFTVEIKVGSPASVKIEADDNILKMIKVKVVNNVLEIHAENNVSFTNCHLNAYVTVPTLESIESSGGATITVVDELKNQNKIRLNASGGSKIKAQVDAPTVNAESSGGANMELSGKTRDLTVDASGGANIHAAELQSENVEADASGAGNVHVYASVKLDAKASGAGNVFYRGGANKVHADESGAGNVKKED